MRDVLSLLLRHALSDTWTRPSKFSGRSLRRLFSSGVRKRERCLRAVQVFAPDGRVAESRDRRVCKQGNTCSEEKHKRGRGLGRTTGVPFVSGAPVFGTDARRQLQMQGRSSRCACALHSGNTCDDFYGKHGGTCDVTGLPSGARQPCLTGSLALSPPSPSPSPFPPHLTLPSSSCSPPPSPQSQSWPRGKGEG